jgi:predicted transcriptional regulator
MIEDANQQAVIANSLCDWIEGSLRPSNRTKWRDDLTTVLAPPTDQPAKEEHAPGSNAAAMARPPSLTAPSEPASPAADRPWTKNEQSMLRAMARFDSKDLVSAAELAKESGLSARKAGDFISDLINEGLAERPRGERQGARLTIPGRREAARFAD